LQAVGQGLHAGLVFVGSEEGVAVRLVFGGHFGLFLLLFGGEFFFEGVNGLLRLLRREQHRPAGQRVLDALRVGVGIEIEILLFPLVAGHHADGITHAGFFSGQLVRAVRQQRCGHSETKHRDK